MLTNMSPCRHILVLSLIFATYQTAKLGDDTSDTPEPPISSFNRTSGSLLVKISMEKAECVNDKYKAENKTDAPTPTTPPNPKDLDRPEKGSNVLGSTIKNPAKSCDYVEEPGSSYIISSGRTIKVKCNVAEEKCTCLSIKGELIEESAINGLAVTLGDQLWLSQTTYDEQSLYNNIEGITGTDIPQISHLLSTSVKVSQRIRYYYSAGNTTTAEDANVKTLKALLWNDQLVGSEITKQMPINFTVSGTEPCWDENTEWMCTNIIFKTQSNNRLPVKDFYIKEVRIKSPGVPDSAVPETGAPKDAPIQKLYFQLTDLCFFYN